MTPEKKSIKVTTVLQLHDIRKWFWFHADQKTLKPQLIKVKINKKNVIRLYIGLVT